jgi:hypothetical protein
VAQITHSTRTRPTPYRARGGTFDFRVFQESTTVSSNIIQYGDVVQFDVNVATANFRLRKSTVTTAPNVLSTAFLGIAMENSADLGSSVSAASPGSNLLVCCANKDTEFKWATKLAGTAHVSSLVGTRAAVGYDSTLNFFYCDPTGAQSTAGDGSLVVTEVIDAGTTNGYVAAKFLSTAIARLISGAY